MKPFKSNLLKVKTKGKPGLLHWDNLNETFETKRVLSLSDFLDLNDSNQLRGKHANRDCNELLFVLSGGITLDLQKGNDKYSFECQKNDYAMIPKNYYLEIKILSKDTTCFVLCDNTR